MLSWASLSGELWIFSVQLSPRKSSLALGYFVCFVLCLLLCGLGLFLLSVVGFLEHGNERVARQGFGTVATVNCSNCQRANDPFSDIDEKN